MVTRMGQVVAGVLALLMFAMLVPVAYSQDEPAAAIEQNAPVVSPEQLDQLLAPIALYPDPLLGQVLMASTYPLEVVEAARWIQNPENAALKGEQLANALEPLDWDPSVKALVPFPQVLQMMTSNLDWMQKLGDAFLAQEDDVMEAVQRLRRQALAAGTLVSTPQQTVTTRDQTIEIQPANPDMLYVPAYQPSVVYAPWPYPVYPPIVVLPPLGYYPGGLVSGVEFGISFIIVRSLWGWGNFDWHRHRIHVDVNRVNVINRYAIEHFHRPPIGKNEWEHNPRHRVGVPYRDPRLRSRVERAPSGLPDARRAYRGYAGAAPVGRIAPLSPIQPRLQSPVRRLPPPAQPQVPPPVGRAPGTAFGKSGSGAETRAHSVRGHESREMMKTKPAVPPVKAPPQGGAPRSGGGTRR